MFAVIIIESMLLHATFNYPQMIPPPVVMASYVIAAVSILTFGILSFV